MSQQNDAEDYAGLVAEYGYLPPVRYADLMAESDAPCTCEGPHCQVCVDKKEPV